MTTRSSNRRSASMEAVADQHKTCVPPVFNQRSKNVQPALMKRSIRVRKMFNRRSTDVQQACAGTRREPHLGGGERRAQAVHLRGSLSRFSSGCLCVRFGAGEVGGGVLRGVLESGSLRVEDIQKNNKYLSKRRRLFFSIQNHTTSGQQSGGVVGESKEGGKG